MVGLIFSFWRVFIDALGISSDLWRHIMIVNLQDGSAVEVRHLYTFPFFGNVTLQNNETVVMGLQGVSEAAAP